MKLPIVKHIFVFTTWGQKCPHSEPEQFTFDNFQSSHPVVVICCKDSFSKLLPNFNVNWQALSNSNKQQSYLVSATNP